MSESVKDIWHMACPNCGDCLRIDVAATVFVRLCRDGTDVFAAANGDHEWTDHSGAKCCACGFGGNVSDFSKAGGQP